MKKWYRSCVWMLAAAMAFELSGCAKGSAILSQNSSKKSDERKLVEVDKAKKKGSTSKKSDTSRDKPAESQLAKKTTKPKVQSSDDTKTAVAAAEPTKPVKKPAVAPKTDPFESEEFEALAAARGKSKKTADPEFAELASKSDAPVKSASKTSDPDSSTRVQEVAHKVEDNLADIGDLPEWAQDGEAPARKDAPRSRPASKVLPAEKADEPADDTEFRVASKPAAAERRTEKAPEATTDMVSLCPHADGEVRDLVASLKESDTDGLKRGIHRLGRMGPEAKGAAPALMHLLKHKDGFVRTHSALALARMQASPPEAVQTVVDGLKSTDPGLRSFAAAVLAEMGPQATEALSTLAESLKDRDGYVRLHAAEVLIRYDRWSYEALETLLGGLSDKDENIRWLATYSLAELAPESQETVDALLKACHDPVMKVKVGAVYALGEIGPFAKGASRELRKLADSTTNQELQSATLYALQQIEAPTGTISSPGNGN